jgi:hypothetical protein
LLGVSDDWIMTTQVTNMKTFQEFQDNLDQLIGSTDDDPSPDEILSTASRLASAAGVVLTEIREALASRPVCIDQAEDMAIQTHVSDILLLTSKLSSQLYLDLEGIALVAKRSAENVAEHEELLVEAAL